MREPPHYYIAAMSLMKLLVPAREARLAGRFPAKEKLFVSHEQNGDGPSKEDDQEDDELFD
jgi:hypothetical protein